MSHSMRLTIVAEGVEQPEQAAWLQHARCSIGQGFLWSRPVELDRRARPAATAASPPPAAPPARTTGCSVGLLERRAQSVRSADRSRSSTSTSSMVEGTRPPCRRRSRASSCAGSCRDRVFGRPPTTETSLKRRDRADLVAHQRRPARARRSSGSCVDAGLEHHEAARHLALQRVGDADHRALGDRGVGGDDGLHRPGGEPVPGDVDDVVGAAHHEEVAVLVDVAAVAGEVVAVEGRQVRRRRTARRRPTASAACPGAAAAAGRSRPPPRRPPACPARRGPRRRSRAPAPSASPA